MEFERHMETARDIMDNACLGEPYIANGVDAALRRDIATALSEAEAKGRRQGLEWVANWHDGLAEVAAAQPTHPEIDHEAQARFHRCCAGLLRNDPSIRALISEDGK